MIDVKSYSVNKDNGKSTGNNNNNNGFANNTTNTTTIANGVQGVNIWGQYHDHTADITGDFTSQGNVNCKNVVATNNITANNNITATNNITSNKVITGDINSTGNLTTNNITANGTVHSTGSITTDSNVSANNIYADGDVICDNIEASSGIISQLQSINITTEYLTVTKAAHFFKLIIDEIKATEGQIIVTPANSGDGLVYVEQDGNYYICYFLAHDMSTGKKINNSFEVGDQVICQTFNAATGTQYNVSNRFYWALCTRVSTQPVSLFVNGANQECHYIYLDWTDKDQGTNCTPAVGDEIVSLGNRTDTTRQAAITIGAYNNPYLDSGIHAPFIIQYDGINDYNLSSHRKNVISNGYNSFFGTFTTTTGDDIEQLINDAQQGAVTYMHMAYANSNDGSVGFSKTYFNNAYYIGFCSNHTQSDAALVYTDYTWCRFRGSNGVNANNYILQSGALSIHVEEDNTSTDDDFIVRGYEFVNNTKTELHHNCKVTYVYESISDYIMTQPLPITVQPYQCEQDFINGLKTIRFEMYDVDDEEIVAQMEIPIIRNGATGQDLEEYKLVPVKETVPIDHNGTVGVSLQYNIMHIVGGNYEMATASNNLCVYFKPHYQTSTSNYTALSTGTTTPTYTNASYQSNWNSSNNKLQYLEIVLANKNPNTVSQTPTIIYDKRVVYAALAPSATFTITDEIKSTVQGHTVTINGLTNSISTIQQAFDQISLTVQSHTTAINNLDGRVTVNETNISNITQRADSIESTVQSLKIGAKNLFNFTNCRWNNGVVPFIQGYGVECKNSGLNRIMNLGFDGIGGDFSLTCWMKMKTTNTNVSVNVCDVNDTAQQTVSVTTIWKQFSFTFKNVTRYIGDASDTGNYNGFLDFESNDISSTNRLYVKDIMLTRGNIPCDFNYSWKDYEYANTDNLIDLSYDTNIAPTNERYKGYVVYKPTQYNMNDGEWSDFIYANNLSLKQNKPYTLSFYAKCEHPCYIEQYLKDNGGLCDGTITSITEPDSEGEMTCGNLNDGYTGCRLGTHWTQFIIHWYNQNTGNRNLIALRDSIDNWDDTSTTPNISICGVEFREGYWDKDLLNSQSLIRQTATEIELAVNNTGINIYDGSIVLNAENTTINGNLNLTDPKQGLILYDQYGNPRISIQNDTLGTLENFDFGQDKLYRQDTTTNVQTATYNVNFPTLTLGNFASGQKLELHDIMVRSFNINNVFDTDITRLAYNYVVKCGNTTITTQSGNATAQGIYYKLGDYSNNSLSNSGTYTIQISLTGYLRTTAASGDFNHSVSLYCRTIQPSINKVATDGAVFASSTQQYNWFGSDQTMLRNGASAIRIKDGHIERNEYQVTSPSYNANFMDISTTMPYKICNDLTYTATKDDGMIAFSNVVGQQDSAQRTLYLPDPSTCAGKQFFVKNLVGSNTNVQVSGAASSTRYFIEHNSNSTVNYLSIDNHSAIIISMGLYWIEFYC